MNCYLWHKLCVAVDLFVCLAQIKYLVMYVQKQAFYTSLVTQCNGVNINVLLVKASYNWITNN